MISQVYSLDLRLFRLINRGINHPLLDQFFNLLADGRVWTPILVLLAILLFLRGGQRIKSWVLFTAIGIAIGDPLICNPLKHFFDRPRPFQAVEGVRDVSPGPADHPWQPSVRISGIPEGDVAHGRSFPSAHVANATTAAFSASLIWGSALRWPWILVGLAAIGRIYTGDHYPTDVLASIPLSIGYTWLLAHGLNQLWIKIGPRFFPNSFALLPSLFPPQ